MSTLLHPTIRRFAILAAAAFLAVGCASTDKARSSAPRKPLAVVEGAHQPGLTSEFRKVFQEKLDELLYGEDGAFTKVDKGPSLRWEVTRVDPGSRALRYFVGFGAGKGTFNARATLLDSKGNILTTTDTEGDQVMGVGGGSFDSAIEEAAENIAEFANRNAATIR